MDEQAKPCEQLSAICHWPLLRLNEKTILEFGINPNYRKHDARSQYAASGVGHPCGDDLTMSLRIHNGFITDMNHSGASCCLTTAFADILCHNLIGQKIDQLISVPDIVDIAVAKNREGCLRLPIQLLKELYGQTQT